MNAIFQKLMNIISMNTGFSISIYKCAGRWMITGREALAAIFSFVDDDLSIATVSVEDARKAAVILNKQRVRIHAG